MVTATDSPAQAPRENIFPVASSREEMRTNLKTQKTLEEISEMIKTQEGKEQLLTMIKDASPNVNGNVDAALDQVGLNAEQLQKKESFIKRMLKLPGQAVSKAWETIKKHPILTAVILIAIAAAGAYYLGYLPKLGDWGLKLKNMLSGEGAVATAEAGSEALGSLDVVLNENMITWGGKTMDYEAFIQEALKMKAENADLFFDIRPTADTRVWSHIGKFTGMLRDAGLTDARDFVFGKVIRNTGQ